VEIKIEDMINKAQMRRLVYPKNPLMIFNELHGDVPIHIQPYHGDSSYSTIGYTFEVRYNFILYCVK